MPEGLPTSLVRLLRRVGGMGKGDTHYRFAKGPVPGWLAPSATLRWGIGADTYLIGVAETLWVVQVEGADVVVLADDLGSWLAGVLDPPDRVRVLPVALPDLGLVGDGQGWALDTLPAILARGGLPEGLRGAPFHLDAQHAWVGGRVVELRPREVVHGETPDGPDLDELFGAGGGRPRPRTALIATLLGVGLVLTLLGMACINAPGGLLVLIAWMLVEKDLERLESGYLPEADRPQVEQIRSMTYAGLVLVILLFFLQGFLLCNGFYDWLLDTLYIPWWRAFVGGLLQG